MPEVSAKVKVASREEFAGGSAKVNITVDYQDGRNKAWAVSTPQLSLCLVVTSDVAGFFAPGKALTLIFEED